MRTLLMAGLVGAAAAAGLGTTASAAPPEPADLQVVTQSCGFPVQVDQRGKTKAITHGDRVITIAPTAKVTLVNPANGATVTLNNSGTFHEQVQPNGDLLGTGTGLNTFAGSGVGTILYTTGPVSYRVDAVTGVLTVLEARKAVDICQQLA